MPDENLTISDLKEAVYPLFQLLNDPMPGAIHYHIQVAQAMDRLTELWGDRFTPPVAPSPAALANVQFLPGAPNREYQVLHIGTETVLVNEEETVVMSQTDAGKRYLVTLPHCECQGFKFRGKCRHIAVAIVAREQYRINHPNPTKGQS